MLPILLKSLIPANSFKRQLHRQGRDGVVDMIVKRHAVTAEGHARSSVPVFAQGAPEPVRSAAPAAAI